MKAWLPSDEVVCNGPGLGLNQACMHEIDFPCGNAMHPCTGRCFTLLGTFHVLSSCALCTHVPPCLQAFKAVLQAGGLVLDDLLTDTKSLRAMVLYHVIEVEVSYREGGYRGDRDTGGGGRQACASGSAWTKTGSGSTCTLDRSVKHHPTLPPHAL